MSATVPVRLDPAVHAELVAMQQEFRAAHRGTISLSDVVAGLLADRRAWLAMGDAALAADRKPVGS